MEFLNSFLPPIQHLGAFGYWVVLLVSLLESLAFVGWLVPGSILVVFAGFLSAGGYLDLGDLIWFAAVGAILGDGISYWLGTKGTQLFGSQNKFLKLNHLEKGEQFFKKHGGKSIFLGRFISYLRSIIPFVAGLSKMDKRTFLLWNVASAFLWATSHLLLGYFFGGALNVIEVWSTRAGIFILTAILAVVIVRLSVKYAKPFFTFLESLVMSIKEAVLANPDVKRFVSNHPYFFSFIRRRFDSSRFSGLTLTLLLIAFVYVFFLFAGTVQDIITTESLVAADIRLANFLYVFREAELIKFSLWVTLLGQWQIIVSSAMVISALLWLWRKRIYILPFWVSVAGSYLFTSLGKVLFHRPRPEVAYYLENSSSFPSGHAAMAVAFYGFITYILFRLLKNWKTKTNILFVGLIVILAIGLSRLYLGVHYLSDVWGGYLLGLLWLMIGISIAEWLKEHNPVLPAVFTQKIKIVSLVLIAAEMIFCISFALHYHPTLAKPVQAQDIVVYGHILDAFQNNKLPHFTKTLIGENQQPLSLIIITKDDQQFVEDMKKAGWQLADRADISSITHLAKSALLNESYPTAPMIPSFWNAKMQDFGFEKPTGAKRVRQRHKARFWRTNLITQDGKHIYVGTASLDVGIKWLIIPKINPDIDTERETIFSDLQDAELVSKFQKDQFVNPTLGQNFSGDQFFTDGEVYLIFLK